MQDANLMTTQLEVEFGDTQVCPQLNHNPLTSCSIMPCQIGVCRLPAKSDPAPSPENFADIVYLKEQSFLHRIRDVCTL